MELDEDLAEKRAIAEKLSKEKQQAWNAERTKRLGENPKAYLAELRASRQPGFYISSSSKKGDPDGAPVWGQCFLIPGLDYVQCEYARVVHAESGDV